MCREKIDAPQSRSDKRLSEKKINLSVIDKEVGLCYNIDK